MQQMLQADGDKLYVYDKDLNQVTVRALGGALGASPAAILFGSNDLDKNFTLRDAGVKGGIDWLELTPKAKDTQFQSVGIGFKDGNLEAMELHDVFGNVTLADVLEHPEEPAAARRCVQVHRAEGRGCDQRLSAYCSCWFGVESRPRRLCVVFLLSVSFRCLARSWRSSAACCRAWRIGLPGVEVMQSGLRAGD